MSATAFDRTSMEGLEAAMNSLQAKTVNALMMRTLSRNTALAQMNSYMQRIQLDISDMHFVHIAGSKGKGSTSSFVENILHTSGYKTGLYTSPHLISLNERFRMNTASLDTERYIHYFWQVWDRLHETHDVDAIVDPQTGELQYEYPPLPSYFAMLTLTAFWAFKHENIDVVVLEVGLGGRLDSTNIVTNPLITGVTTLSLEHTEILGKTIDRIAYEKSGIFKPNSPIVTFPQDPIAWRVILDEAQHVGQLPILINPDAFDSHIQLGLNGDYQSQNASLALILSAVAIQRLNQRGVVPTYAQENNTANVAVRNAGIHVDHIAPGTKIASDASTRQIYDALLKQLASHTTASSPEHVLDDATSIGLFHSLETLEHFLPPTTQSERPVAQAAESLSKPAVDLARKTRHVHSARQHPQVQNELWKADIAQNSPNVQDDDHLSASSREASPIRAPSVAHHDTQIPMEIISPDRIPNWSKNICRDLHDYLALADAASRRFLHSTSPTLPAEIHTDAEPLWDQSAISQLKSSQGSLGLAAVDIIADAAQEQSQSLIAASEDAHIARSKSSHDGLSTTQSFSPLDYPSFHIHAIPPAALLALCTTTLRARCDTLTSQTPNLIWYVDGAHTAESIESTARWYHKMMQYPPLSAYMAEKVQHWLAQSNQQQQQQQQHPASSSSSSTDANVAIAAAAETPEPVGVDPSTLLIDSNDAVRQLSHYPYFTPLLSLLYDDAADASPTVPPANAFVPSKYTLSDFVPPTVRRVLAFNCGNVRSPFNLLVPLVRVVPSTLPSTSSTTTAAAQLNATAHRIVVPHLDDFFEHVFFCPFDHDRLVHSRPLSLPELLSSYLSSPTSNSSENHNDDIFASLRRLEELFAKQEYRVDTIAATSLDVHTPPTESHSSPVTVLNSKKQHLSGFSWQLNELVIWDFLVQRSLVGTLTLDDSSSDPSTTQHQHIPQAQSHNPGSITFLNSVQRTQSGQFVNPSYSHHEYQTPGISPAAAEPVLSSKSTPAVFSLPSFLPRHDLPIDFHPPLVTISQLLDIHQIQHDTSSPTRRQVQFHVMPTSQDVVNAIQHLTELNNRHELLLQSIAEDQCEKTILHQQQQQQQQLQRLQQKQLRVNQKQRRVNQKHADMLRQELRQRRRNDARQHSARRHAKPTTRALVAGSLYLSGNVLKHLGAKV